MFRNYRYRFQFLEFPKIDENIYRDIVRILYFNFANPSVFRGGYPAPLADRLVLVPIFYKVSPYVISETEHDFFLAGEDGPRVRDVGRLGDGVDGVISFWFIMACNIRCFIHSLKEKGASP